MFVVARSRRQVQDADSVDLSVAMPSVNWNRDFGDGNISVSLNRRIRNGFGITTGNTVIHSCSDLMNYLLCVCS